MDPLTVIAGIALAAWGWLLAARGGFWRADTALPADLPAAPPRRVAVLVPARDEAETIGATVAGLFAAGERVAVSVTVIDDGSTDGTAAVARAAAPEGAALRVIAAPPLPAGWTGKLWALETGRCALPEADFVALVDADIRLAPGTLDRLVAMAEGRALALVSLMARLDARGLWGALLIPAFVFFFQKLYPFRWVAEPSARTAAAAGGCVLLRADALEAIGGFAALRAALIDDCTLAALVKRRVGPVWLGLSRGEAVSMRDNRRLASIWAMVTRTAFAQLRHSTWMLGGAVAGMVLLYLAGPLAVLLWPWHGNGVAAALGAAAWSAMAVAYAPTLADYGKPRAAALLLPVAALLYTAMTLDSARAHRAGRGGAWKGRTYPAG